jgi:hypothetical protein
MKLAEPTADEANPQVEEPPMYRLYQYPTVAIHVSWYLSGLLSEMGGFHRKCDDLCVLPEM